MPTADPTSSWSATSHVGEPDLRDAEPLVLPGVEGPPAVSHSHDDEANHGGAAGHLLYLLAERHLRDELRDQRVALRRPGGRNIIEGDFGFHFCHQRLPVG
jgi:hypothetical protein